MQFGQLKRREFITALSGAVTWPLVARAQQPARRSIGVLWPASAPPPPPRMESFRLALKQLGFVEGQNLTIQLRYAEKGPQQLPDLAAELVRAKVDVIAAFGDVVPRVAHDATSKIPIVAISDDILGTGLIDSLARPGRNVTGLTIMSPELSAKRLELLQEMVPGLSYVAALSDATIGRSQVSATQDAARAMSLKLEVMEARSGDEIADAFRIAKDKGAQAVNVLASPILSQLFREVIGASAKYRLPAIYQWKEHADAGGLISYGPSLAAMWRQSGTIVATILNGANPQSLPFEHPIKFELAVNARTADALGLRIPPSVLVRADEVIE
jgi:putative tryptophan/tyrosine transport system substrate-binding protein